MKILKKIGYLLNHITSIGGYASEGSTRFLRFATSNTFTLIVDFLVLIFLVEIMFPNYFIEIKIFNEIIRISSKVISAGVAFTISTSLSYFINRTWSFKGTVINVFKGYGLFLSFGIFGLFLTLFLMWLFVDVLGIYYIFSRIVVAGIEGFYSFLANSIFTFKIPLRFGKYNVHKTMALNKDKF